jgi:hypothetical protein
MRIYITKPNTWFMSNTEVRLIEYLTIDKDGQKYGTFEGLRENFNGEITRQTEVCSYDEFDIIDNE